MSEIQSDQEVVRNGRKNILKDDPDQGIQVTADLRDQQLEKLAKKLEDMSIGKKVVDTWMSANNDRSAWLERQDRFLQEIDEFIDPIYDQALDWSSVLHLPTLLTVCKTYHARMYAALLSIDPPFSLKARQAANSDRAPLIEELLRYTLRDWCNDNEGVEEVADRWLWDWITRGVGYLKGGWDKKFTRYLDVEVDYVEQVDLETDPQTGEDVPVKRQQQVQREVQRTEEIFNGPTLKRVPVEDLVVVGGEGDPQKADYVIEQFWLTASDLYQLSDQKRFRAKEVDRVLRAGKDYPTGNDQTSAIKQNQMMRSGMSDMNREHELDRYRILEAHLRIDVDGSGIASDIIVWVHWATRAILRATYLRRVSPTGVRPYFPIFFHLRQGVEYPAGLVELLYSLGKEIDAIHNIKVDIGILTSMPFGFYRPTASSLKEERLPMEPGALIPVDNPQTDIYFPNMGTKTAFGFQEEQALQTQIERLTSMSDLQLGIIGGQGVARTATGARAVLGEASNNLNIYIQRMNRGWKRALRFIFAELQVRIPDGFQFRILGDDGSNYWAVIKSKEEIAGLYDFELEANSANSNKQIQVEQANMLVQLTGNPLDLQLGIVTPYERYQALSYMLKVNGVKDVAKFLRKPEGSPKFSPIELADRVLMGMPFPMDPTQDLQGFINVVDEIVNNDEMNGQFDQFQIISLVSAARQAQGLLRSLQQQQANQAALDQQQMNAVATMTPQNLQPVNVYQQPPQGEGA